MADSAANSSVVEAQLPKFATGDEVKLTVDGVQYDAVVKAVTLVGGSAATYTVERGHDGVTGFKSEKYVPESRLSAKETLVETPVETAAPKVEDTSVENSTSKEESPSTAKTPEVPESKEDTKSGADVKTDTSTKKAPKK